MIKRRSRGRVKIISSDEERNRENKMLSEVEELLESNGW